MVGDTGIEPVYDGIKIRCLTILANPQQQMERNIRIELMTGVWKTLILPLN